MPRERVTMRKIREILRLVWSCNQSRRDTSRTCGVGKTTVDDTINRAIAAGFSWPLPTDLDDEALELRLYATAFIGTVNPWYPGMKIGFILEEVQMLPGLLSGVIRRSRGIANRTCERCSALKVDGYIKTIRLLGKAHLCDFPGRDYAKGHTKKSFRLHKSVKPPGNGLKTDYTITHSRRRRASKNRPAEFQLLDMPADRLFQAVLPNP